MSDFSSSVHSATTNIMPAGSATLDRECSVLLAACSLASREEKSARLSQVLPVRPLDWEALLALAENHGVQPLLHQALKGNPSVAPENMSRLQQAYQTNLHKTLLLSRELIRIVDLLSARGIEAIPYKGPALAEAIYGDIALRHAGDIDLLIRPQDLPGVRDAVRELGYAPHANFSPAEERAYMKSGYEYAFDGPGGPNLLEVQWAILPRFYSINFETAGFFKRSIAISVAGQFMRSLSYEDLFLVLSVHAAKHLWGRLIWVSDLARLMGRTDLDWRLVGSEARELGIVRILRVTMELANRWLDADIPNAAHEAVPEDREATQITEEVQTLFASNTIYNFESLDYFRLMMRLRERASDRFQFVQRLLFTPGPGEWQAVQLPASLFSLYRVVRLGRLAGRLTRTRR